MSTFVMWYLFAGGVLAVCVGVALWGIRRAVERGLENIVKRSDPDDPKLREIMHRVRQYYLYEDQIRPHFASICIIAIIVWPLSLAVIIHACTSNPDE